MKVKFSTKLIASLCLCSSLFATSASAESNFAVVNGVGLPQSQLDFNLKAKAGSNAKNPNVVHNIKTALINRELIVQEAKKKGLDRDGDIVRMIEDAKQEIIAQNYYANFLKTHPVNDATVKKEYDDMRAKTGNTEYKVRHILVEKEEDAKAIIAKLGTGTKFETLASQSKDPGSKERGGDLGWNVPNAFVKPFADAMVQLGKGQYTTTPVKSQFGYHVIKLEQSRTIKVPSYEQIKLQIRQQMQQRAFAEHLEQLRKSAKIQ